MKSVSRFLPWLFAFCFTAHLTSVYSQEGYPVYSDPHTDDLMIPHAQHVTFETHRKKVLSLIFQKKLSLALAYDVLNDEDGDHRRKVIVLLKQMDSDKAKQVSQEIFQKIQVEQVNGWEDIIGQLISSIVPILLSVSPEFAAVLGALNMILSYFTPMIEEKINDGSAGPLLKILFAFLTQGSGALENISSLLNGLLGGDSGLSLFGLIPSLIGQLLGGGLSGNGFDNFLGNLLMDRELSGEIQELLGGQGFLEQGFMGLIPFLQPLMNGLLGKGKDDIEGLLNWFIGGLNQRDRDPIEVFRNLDLVEVTHPQTKLMPYLAPLRYGLRSPYGDKLEQFLRPYFQADDPAKALKKLATFQGSLFRRLLAQAWWQNQKPELKKAHKQWDGVKSVLGAQLFEAMVNQKVKNYVVYKDHKKSPALTLDLTRDQLLQVGKLPNVFIILETMEGNGMAVSD